MWTGCTDVQLCVVPGSHLLREGRVADHSEYATDQEWRQGWLQPRGLKTQTLEAPPDSVVIVHTWTAHAVLPKSSEGIRWAVVYGYRVPGAHSDSRMVTEGFEKLCGVRRGDDDALAEGVGQDPAGQDMLEQLRRLVANL